MKLAVVRDQTSILVKLKDEAAVIETAFIKD